MGFSRQECWSGLPFLSSGDLPDPGISPQFTALQPDALQSSHQGSPLAYLNIIKRLLYSISGAILKNGQFHVKE